jgi:hypothetical protein
MNLVLKIAQTGAALAVLVFFALASWVLWNARTSQLPLHADQVLTRLNSPTGPITETDKLLLALNSTTVHADLVIAHEDKNIGHYDQLVGGLFDRVDRLADRGSATLDAATATEQAATETLGTLNSTIGQAQPLLEAYTASGNDLHELLKRKALADFADNLGPLSANMVAITGTGAHMMATGDAVETKATQSYLHPSHNPWARTWQAVQPFIVAGAKITANVF